MRKFTAFVLILLGVLMILISIMALVRAFDVFSSLHQDSWSYGYVFGSIVFPLLLTVFGRWVYRKGPKILREKTKK
jgi:multisubunit Na+/H+ antiporter MnhG subunit